MSEYLLDYDSENSSEEELIEIVDGVISFRKNFNFALEIERQ